MSDTKDLCLNCGTEHERELWGAKCNCGAENVVHQRACNGCGRMIGQITDDDYCRPEKLYCPDCMDKARKKAKAVIELNDANIEMLLKRPSAPSWEKHEMTTCDHKAAKELAMLYTDRANQDKECGNLSRCYLDLREKARDMLDFMKRAPVSSGVCCCGEDMTRHNSSSMDHSPVDLWDNAVIQYEKALRAILVETGND